MRTAKKMNIKTVAVYSDADASAMFTEMADEAVHIVLILVKNIFMNDRVHRHRLRAI